MTKIKDPISQISQIEKEAKNLILKAEENAKKSIRQAESKREEEIAKVQNKALENTTKMVKLAKDDIEKHRGDNKKIIEKQLAKIIQDTKNNFSKVSSFVIKIICKDA
jgi:vacuolar-type H+-ATPase subunit H